MKDTTINKGVPPTAMPDKVGRNFFWLVWSGIISIANSILLWIFLAQTRDVAEVGKFTIVMALYAMFVSICSFGLMPFIVSEISRRREHDAKTIAGFISSASVLLTIAGLVCAVLMTISGVWTSGSPLVQLSTLILSIAMIPTGLIAVGEATSIALGRTRLIAFVTTLENILRTIIPIGLIWFGYDISAVCASFVAVRFVALFIYLIAAREQLSDFAFSRDEFRLLVKVAPTFAGTVIFAAVNWQVVIVLLGHYSTEIESAKYGVASRFLIPVAILMASYSSVIQPGLAQFAQNGMHQAGSYLSKMARYPLVFATVAAILAPFLSNRVLTFLFGVNYSDAAPTLEILALSTVPFCMVMVAARGLVATGSQHIDLIANALGVIVCFSAGLILIPEYGAVGAAVAQFLSFLLMSLVEVGYLSRKIAGFNIWRVASVSSAGLLIAYIFKWKE